MLSKKTLLVVLLLISLFTIRAFVTLDPDFGWHLRMGELISHSGIPKSDPFSYTMPSFPSIDHEWFTNLFLFYLYPLAGKLGLSIIFSLISILALFIATRSPLVIILASSIIFPYHGVRPQVQSWLYLSVLLSVVLNENLWKHFRYFIPLFVVIWTNLHGSFPISLTVLFIIFVFKSLEKKALQKDILLIFLLSIPATFINPYGPRIWDEIWMQMSDSHLRWRIAEWLPGILSFNPPLVVLSTLSTIFIIRYRVFYKLEEMALFTFFLIEAIATSRHIPLWVIVAMPLTVKGFKYLKKEASTFKGGTERFITFNKILTAIILICVLAQYIFEIHSMPMLSEKNFYPAKAVEFFTLGFPQSDREWEIFSTYGWGGYLLWKLPERKVFIDGRMPSWRRNKKSTPSGELSNAMDTYINITEGKEDYKNYFEMYNITTVLWPIENAPENSISQLAANFFRKIIKKEETPFSFVETLKIDGWQELYKDNTAVVLEMP